MALTLIFTQSTPYQTNRPVFQFKSGGGFDIPEDNSFYFEPNGSFDFTELVFTLNQMQFTVTSEAIFDGQINAVLKGPTGATTGTIQPVFHMQGFASDTVTVQWTDSNGDQQQQQLYSGQTLTLTNYQLP